MKISWVLLMNNLRLLGIGLILFAIYTPISLFCGLAPFGTLNTTTYIYSNPAHNEVYNLPIVISKPSDTLIKTSEPLDNPEQYSLILTKVNHNDTTNNYLYLPSSIIFAVSLAVGILLTIRLNK